MTEINELDENELYFWYDPDSGDLEALVEEEFQQRITEILDALYKWENVIG